jgi:hypothetical protein
MPFLKNLFAKKEGGTMVGNFFRGLSNKATDGLIGNGDNMIKPIDGTFTSKQELSAQIGAKLGEHLQPIVSEKTEQVLNTPTGQSVSNAIISTTLKNFLKKNWFLLLFPLSFLLYYIIKKATNRRK